VDRAIGKPLDIEDRALELEGTYTRWVKKDLPKVTIPISDRRVDHAVPLSINEHEIGDLGRAEPGESNRRHLHPSRCNRSIPAADEPTASRRCPQHERNR